jgi:hypothetical protein
MTTTDRATVMGVFPSQEQADQAVEELHHAGFSYSDIGFVARNTKVSGPGLPSTEATTVRTTDTDVAGTTGETANRVAAGATGGGVVGGLLGAAATLLIPGLGPITAAGILVGVLTGLVAGGLVGALTGMGLSEDEARYYNKEVAAGRVLVTVNATTRQTEARDILRRCGAVDMQTRNPVEPDNYATQPDMVAAEQPEQPATSKPVYESQQYQPEQPLTNEPDYEPWQYQRDQQPHPQQP